MASNAPVRWNRGSSRSEAKVFTDGIVRLDTDKEISVTITVDVSLLTKPVEA